MVSIFKHIPLVLCVVNEHVVDWTWICNTNDGKKSFFLVVCTFLQNFYAKMPRHLSQPTHLGILA